MFSNYVIAFCLLSFTIAVLYAFLAIVFNHKFSYLTYTRRLIKEPVLAPVILGLLLLIIFLGLHFLVNNPDFQTSLLDISPKEGGKGAVGDFFNGLIAPTISIISIFFLYKAFQQQYEANQMIIKFEIERGFKEELDWLKNNTEIVEDIEASIVNQTIASLEAYLRGVTGIVEVRKGIFIINLFQKLHLQSRETKSNLNPEIRELFTSLYLPSYKNIYREFYLYITDQTTLNRNAIEVILLEKFTKLYDDFKDSDDDPSFTLTHNAVKKLF